MQGTFAGFLFLPSFAVESFARNVQNGFTLSFDRERLFLFFCFANKRKEIDINGNFVYQKGTDNMNYVTNYLTCRAMTEK